MYIIKINRKCCFLPWDSGISLHFHAAYRLIASVSVNQSIMNTPSFFHYITAQIYYTFPNTPMVVCIHGHTEQITVHRAIGNNGRHSFRLHTDTHVLSLQAALPEMLLPSGPQSSPSALITARTLFHISQGALQAHNTPWFFEARARFGP